MELSTSHRARMPGDLRHRRADGLQLSPPRLSPPLRSASEIEIGDVRGKHRPRATQHANPRHVPRRLPADNHASDQFGTTARPAGTRPPYRRFDVWQKSASCPLRRPGRDHRGDPALAGHEFEPYFAAWTSPPCAGPRRIASHHGCSFSVSPVQPTVEAIYLIDGGRDGRIGAGGRPGRRRPSSGLFIARISTRHREFVCGVLFVQPSPIMMMAVFGDTAIHEHGLAASPAGRRSARTVRGACFRLRFRQDAPAGRRPMAVVAFLLMWYSSPTPAW